VLWAALPGSSWFSTLDLRSGYHNIPVAEKDRGKTASVTSRRRCCFTVIPFGLTSAPSVFQRLMDVVLWGLSYELCLVYLDDIIVLSNIFWHRMMRLKDIFKRLRWARFKQQISKCNFVQRKSALPWHTVFEAGIEMQQEKIDAVLKLPTPRDLSDVRSFTGTCSYYRRFVASFADAAAPLHELNGKGVRFASK